MDRSGEMSVFVRVVDEGGFSAAARSLHLSPSAVSKLVTRLEDRLGARLLNRTTRRLSLTEEGDTFYQRATQILTEIDEAELAVARLHAIPGGQLRVTAAVAFAIYQIVPVLPVFLERYPEVHVELDVNDRIVDLVQEGFDVGVRTGARQDSSLVSRVLAQDHRTICAAPAYLERHGAPETPADLLRHNCITWTGNPGGLNDWPFEGPDGPYTVRVRGNAEVNNGEALHEMALAGIGLAHMAEFRVGEDVKIGRLMHVLTDHHRVVDLPIHVAYPHRRHLSARVRAFVDFLVETFSPAPPWSAT